MVHPESLVSLSSYSPNLLRETGETEMKRNPLRVS